MTPQTFSLEMCRLLSSLVPGFEGHYCHVVVQTCNSCMMGDPEKHTHIMCRSEIAERENSPIKRLGLAVIHCPAWQVEDVLRNLEKILCVSGAVGTRLSPAFNEIGAMITLKLFLYPDTAYQKIEEYLWSILK